MRAVRFHQLGDPSVLRVEEVPGPRAPRGDELLVRVEASSVNGTDLGLRRGELRVATWGRLPLVPGFDLSGEVLQCGPAVTAFAPGDRVVALLGHGGGGLAEQVLLRQGRAARAPVSCSPEAAAALPLAGLTALQALYGKGQLRARRSPARVLVIGAAGGIGSYAVLLARLLGAHVTGVASGPKLAYVSGLGADEVVDYRAQDVRTLRERWDVVLDAPGLHRYHELRSVLADGGTMVSTRPVSPDSLRAAVGVSLGAVARRSRADARREPRFAAVMTQARSQDLAHLVSLVDRGLLEPPLSRTFPLDEATQAHRHAEGPATGKVVIRVGSAPPA